jgi:hypothetical protein
VNSDNIFGRIFQYYTARDRATFYHTTVTYNLPRTGRQTLKTLATWVYYRRTLCLSSSVKKNPDIGSGATWYISLGEFFFNSSAQYFQDPLTFCFKQQEARGLYSVSAFFSEKAHTTQWFFQEFKISLWNNSDQACFTWRDLKKQEGFRFRPWNARGLIDTGPIRFLIGTTLSSGPRPGPQAWQQRRDIRWRRLRVE